MFCRERSVENLAVCADNVVVWQSDKPVKLKSGLKTLAKALKTDIEEMKDRNAYSKTFAEDILRRYQNTDFLVLEGPRFLGIVYGEQTTKAVRNAYIFKADLAEATKRRMVEPALVNDQKVLAGLEEEKRRNPD